MAKWHSERTHCKHGHEFTVENTLLRGNERKCIACKREWQRNHKSEQKVAHRRRSEQAQVWINEYLKTHPCVDCGEADPLVLEFDHVRGKQGRKVVTRMTLYSLSSILKEIENCEVVCANDHARRTFKRANSIRWRLNS